MTQFSLKRYRSRSGSCLISIALTILPPSFAFGGDSLEQQMAKVRESQGVPALGALLWKEDSIQSKIVVGIRKVGNPTLVSKDDKFHLGSDTKAMTATLVALFVDENKLSWTKKLDEIMPELTHLDPVFKNVTLEMLLAHRSGLSGDLPGFQGGKLWQTLLDPKIDPTLGRKILATQMLTHPPAAQPGSAYEYSNANYVIVGHLLEKISGKTWEELLQKKLFQPLNMRSCGFGPLGAANSANPDQPWAHTVENGTLKPVVLDNPPTLGPAGTVHCSLEDWSKFVAVHVQGYHGKNDFLKRASFQKLHTPYPGQEYTYGAWIKVDRQWAKGPAFTHDGSNTLNYASVWWAPHKNLIAMSVTNRGGPQGMQAAQEAINHLIQR